MKKSSSQIFNHGRTCAAVKRAIPRYYRSQDIDVSAITQPIEFFHVRHLAIYIK